jgi:hypothetical protein
MVHPSSDTLPPSTVETPGGTARPELRAIACAIEPQLELAVVEYTSWFNNARLHESLGDIPPVEYEQEHALPEATTLAETNV